jgi:hypothetical protein
MSPPFSRFKSKPNKKETAAGDKLSLFFLFFMSSGLTFMPLDCFDFYSFHFYYCVLCSYFNLISFYFINEEIFNILSYDCLVDYGYILRKEVNINFSHFFLICVAFYLTVLVLFFRFL